MSGWQLTQQADNGLILLITGARSELSDETLTSQIGNSPSQEDEHVPYIRIQPVSEIPKIASGEAPLIKAFRQTSV